jgi:hypothetical protein
VSEDVGVFARFMRGLDRVLGGEPERVIAINTGRSLPGTTTSLAENVPERTDGPTWWDAQSIEASRIERYRDLREARNEVPEWERMIQVRKGYAFNAKVGDDGRALSYGLTFGKGARPQVIAICEAVTDALEMHAVIPDIYDAGQWLGDSYEELVFDLPSRALVNLRHWEPERVIPKVNRGSGNVSHFSVAVQDEFNPTQAIGERYNVPQFMMLHYAPNRVRGQVCGRSMFGSGRKERREYEAANDALILALSRAVASDNLLWPFPREMKPDKLWAWVRQVRNSVELNLQFSKDGVLRRRFAKLIETAPHILPFLVDPDLKDPPQHFQSAVPNLEQMLRVAQWKQDNNFITGGVPSFLCGMERNVNAKATATEQSAQFAVAIMADQTECAQDVISPIYVRACMAQGYVPQRGEIRIEMFPPSQLYELQRAEVAKTQAECAKIMKEADLPPAFALKRAFNLGDVEVTDVLATVGPPDTRDMDAVEAWFERATEAAAAMFGGNPAQMVIDVTAREQPAVEIPGT